MSLHAWKIMALARPPHQKTGTLDELEVDLDASGLPGASPAKPVTERTRLMQSEARDNIKNPRNGKAGPCSGLSSSPAGRRAR